MGDHEWVDIDFPEQLLDEEFVTIALLATGNVLYEEADPVETVEFVVVDRRLEEDSRTEITSDQTGEFLREVEQRLGIPEWADETAAALYGGDCLMSMVQDPRGPENIEPEVFETLWQLYRRGERDLLKGGVLTIVDARAVDGERVTVNKVLRRLAEKGVVEYVHGAYPRRLPGAKVLGTDSATRRRR